MKKLYTWLTITLFTCGTALYGQEIAGTTISKPVPLSPDAASVMLYQTYPIDYVSGAPQISIPLFSVKTVVGDIPFSLDYQIGKVKPSQLSGIVGTGWTLSPNMSIMRTVHGMEDLVNYGYPVNSQFGSTSDAYLYAAAIGSVDEQPDDYFYSLLSGGGSFLYKRGTGFVPLSYAQIRIEHSDDNSFVLTDENGIQYFFGKDSHGSDTVTEMSGTDQLSVYTRISWKIKEIVSYTKKDTIRFYYNTLRDLQMVPYYNAQWKVIEYPLQQVNLTDKEPQVYKTTTSIYNGSAAGQSGFEALQPAPAYTGDFTTGFDLLQTSSVPTSDYKMTLYNEMYSQAPGSHKAIWNAIGDYGTSYADGHSVQYNYTKQAFLDSITYRGGKVVFSYMNDKSYFHQLAALYQYEGQKLTKKIKFVQHRRDYEDVGQRPPIITYGMYSQFCNRYFLDSVVILGSDTTQPGLRYGLSYTTDKLGTYSNYNTDYWDFLNNKGQNNIPHVPYYLDHYTWYTEYVGGTIDDDSTTGSHYQTPVWLELGSLQERTSPATVLPGLISRISYPTGGSASFEFEENRYESLSESSDTLYGGGYRIKNIRYVNSLGQDSLIKRYKYGFGESGIGFTKNSQSNYNFMYQQYTNSESVFSITDTLKKITYLNSRPFLDNAFSNGAAVLYRDVTEYHISPATNQPLGKTAYGYYVNNNTISPGISMTPIYPDARDAWNNIVPRSVTHYRYDGSGYIPVQGKKYTYASFHTDTVPAAQTYLNWYAPVESEQISQSPQVNVANGKFPHVDYNLLCGVNKLVREVDTLYDQPSAASYAATVTDYQYEPQYLYMSRSVTTDSRGHTHTAHYWYPFQSTAPGYDYASQQYRLSNMADNYHRISGAIQKVDSVDGQLSATVRQEYISNNTPPLLGAVYSAVRNNTATLGNQVFAYDIYGNVREQEGTDRIRQTFLWGYHSRYPVAKIIGSSYESISPYVNQVLLDNDGTTDDAMRTALQQLRTSLSGAQVWTYTYRPGIGMTSETDPRGYTIYYKYDQLGRLTEKRDSNGKLLETHDYHYVNQ